MYWELLTAEELERFEALVATFVRDTRWEAARGFRLDGEIRLVIAAQACLLLLGLDIDEFPGVSSVIVHPTTMRFRGHRSVGNGLMASGTQALHGQAHYRGPVVLAWNAADRDARQPGRGRNVVLHEFAHQLDMLDGTIDGTPPLAGDEQRQRWVDVCTRAFGEVRAGRATVLRDYAATNPAEFFAVATEVFFTRPTELRAEESDLYDVLADFYGQDPALRFSESSSPPRA